MSTTEIMRQLPNLSLKDRQAIIEELFKLEASEQSRPTRHPKQPVRYHDVGLLTKNPSFGFLREEPDLYE